jgi:hypothetical protein
LNDNVFNPIENAVRISTILSLAISVSTEIRHGYNLKICRKGGY